jgi:hypothetical protein
MRDRGEPSGGMTAVRAVRAAKLEEVGFGWGGSARGARDETGWEAWLPKLEAYKRRHGDCSVPKGLAEDPRLGDWVATQRMLKKALHHGDARPVITAARAAKLEALGFTWGLSAAELNATMRNDAG